MLKIEVFVWLTVNDFKKCAAAFLSLRNICGKTV